MRVKLPLILCSDDGQEETVTDVVTLQKDSQRIEHLGLHLREAKQLLDTIQKRLLQQQMKALLDGCSTCPNCGPPFKPTVSLDVIALVTSSCRYDRGQIEHRAAHAFAAHVATQRGRAKRRQHRPPPRAQPDVHGCPRGVAPIRYHTARRDTPVAAHGRRNDAIAAHASGGAARSLIQFSPPGHGLATTAARRQ
jgi:hypothetical protein